MRVEENLNSSNTPLHVLTLTPFYPTREDDASGCFVAEPLAVLSRMGVVHSIIAVTPFYRGAGPVHPAAPRAQWLRYAALPGGWGLASSGAFLSAALISRIRALHEAQPIDLIHAHGPLPCGHAALLVKRKLGLPYVVSVHGVDAYAEKQVPGFPGRWCKRVSREVFQSADRVICVSERVQQSVQERNATSRTVVVYNGADPSLFAPASAASIEHEGVLQPPATILSIGNLIGIKGHEVLLRAIAELAGSHPSILCEIVGEGPLRQSLEAIAKELGIAHRVRFLGRLGRNDVAARLRSATLFVLPSSYEALGCVYLEAMASETPTVGCWGQGIQEIIRHRSNGWLVKPNNVGDLANGIANLLEDAPLQKSIAREGRQTVLRDYTLDHQAERLRRVYQEVSA